jgi:hypothetical protein
MTHETRSRFDLTPPTPELALYVLCAFVLVALLMGGVYYMVWRDERRARRNDQQKVGQHSGKRRKRVPRTGQRR